MSHSDGIDQVLSPGKDPKHIVKFTNCFILRSHQILKDDLWVQGGKIIDPETLFFEESILPDQVIDCGGALISPGLIDVQLNGGFGVDFSYDTQSVEQGILKVAQGILAHGVTSFCPTLVTSLPHVYHTVLPHLKKRKGGAHGAEVLGAHVEGPFINFEKRGAHHPDAINNLKDGVDSLIKVYKHLDSVALVTLAPELENSTVVIEELSRRGIVVSVGHSMASIADGERAIRHGASFITHLFNAMLPFHHRDPGLVGLLASDEIPPGKTIYYGIICDGIHTHPATIRIAYRTYPKGIVLVTDACSALGLQDGIHHIGQQVVEVRGPRAFLAGTNTLAGGCITMMSCVDFFWKTTGCSLVEALEAATLHPATAMGIVDSKGTLDFHTDADFTIVNQETLEIISTWIAGECVYRK